MCLLNSKVATREEEEDCHSSVDSHSDKMFEKSGVLYGTGKRTSVHTQDHTCRKLCELAGMIQMPSP